VGAYRLMLTLPRPSLFYSHHLYQYLYTDYLPWVILLGIKLSVPYIVLPHTLCQPGLPLPASRDAGLLLPRLPLLLPHGTSRPQYLHSRLAAIRVETPQLTG
jgi:hypothetical protein